MPSRLKHFSPCSLRQFLQMGQQCDEPDPFQPSAWAKAFRSKTNAETLFITILNDLPFGDSNLTPTAKSKLGKLKNTRSILVISWPRPPGVISNLDVGYAPKKKRPHLRRWNQDGSVSTVQYIAMTSLPLSGRKALPGLNSSHQNANSPPLARA